MILSCSSDTLMRVLLFYQWLGDLWVSSSYMTCRALVLSRPSVLPPHPCNLRTPDLAGSASGAARAAWVSGCVPMLS